jgi:hypothetical protein
MSHIEKIYRAAAKSYSTMQNSFLTVKINRAGTTPIGRHDASGIIKRLVVTAP